MRNYKNITNFAKKATSQITLSTLLTKRASFNGTWQPFDIKDLDNEFEKIVELIGGQKRTKAYMLRNLKNGYAYSNWCTDRIQYSAKNNQWSYCAGQDYPYEIKQVRNHLK